MLQVVDGCQLSEGQLPDIILLFLSWDHDEHGDLNINGDNWDTFDGDCCRLSYNHGVSCSA